jgi:hypothetical protein
MKRFALVLFIAVAIIPSFSHAQVTEKKAATFNAANRPKNLSDSALLDLVQKQTFRYFWDFAHPVSGLARERSNVAYNYGNDVVTIGGTGFGIMSIIVATERKWITRDTAAKMLLKMIQFLSKSYAYHGVFPHWLNGATGKTIPFSRKDDGADLVETSYLFQGLLCARQYFIGDNRTERELRSRIGWMWNDIEWNWFTKEGQEVLYWHWSPYNGFDMNFPVWGWNECLITYIMAASSPNKGISKEAYDGSWAGSQGFKNGRE